MQIKTVLRFDDNILLLPVTSCPVQSGPELVDRTKFHYPTFDFMADPSVWNDVRLGVIPCRSRHVMCGTRAKSGTDSDDRGGHIVRSIPRRPVKNRPLSMARLTLLHSP